MLRRTSTQVQRDVFKIQWRGLLADRSVRIMRVRFSHLSVTKDLKLRILIPCVFFVLNFFCTNINTIVASIILIIYWHYFFCETWTFNMNIIMAIISFLLELRHLLMYFEYDWTGWGSFLVKWSSVRKAI